MIIKVYDLTISTTLNPIVGREVKESSENAESAFAIEI